MVALYNPASEQRRIQLSEARTILSAHRPPDCPVVVARNLGRAGEQVTVTTLVELDTETVDMLTVVVVGSSRTRRVQHAGRAWLYTPRGYQPAGAAPRVVESA